MEDKYFLQTSGLCCAHAFAGKNISIARHQVIYYLLLRKKYHRGWFDHRVQILYFLLSGGIT